MRLNTCHPKCFMAGKPVAEQMMWLVACLEKADIQWCAIGGIAVNH